MVEFKPAFICRCKIVQNKIVFCTLHKQAETLLAVCGYLQKFIRDVKLGETAYSAQSGHSFRSIPATDSADCGRGRSEATLEFFS